MRRVAVTGIGVASPLGHTTAEVFENALLGRSAVRRWIVPGCNGPVESAAATVTFEADKHFEPMALRTLDRVAQLAVLAARRALGAAAPPWDAIEKARTGVFVGTGMGAQLSLDEGYKRLYEERSSRINPLTILLGMHNSPAAWIAIENQIVGPSLTYATACSSSTVAIGEAWLRLSRGELDMAIAGGSEAPLSLGSITAWSAMRAMAPIDPRDPASSCKPFAKDRSGMVLGEGAAMLVLEPLEHAVRRGASLYGEVLGYGLATDVGHIARPGVAAQASALRAALRSADLPPAAVDAINAHGTGTQANDRVETAAIRVVFGTRAERIPVSATKAIHGHLLGASGALECVLSLLAMQHGVIFPTMHLALPDPECDLDYVPAVARHDESVHTMLSSSFAFGGTNAVLVLGSGIDRPNGEPGSHFVQ